eukprot:CAMPEP_0115156080 /NCGR_PEP_ID=MMETSP0227-20121206/68241_1 /TAXON_ID=89957 /ORGANISM="Polarella glacialis, Strain CCMP 1383" /LENGTH=191 /DNA_ID=CAMNT_0002567207 /DNA_START=40 /DNA_END=615 /DNA_ORIENTATION=-
MPLAVEVSLLHWDILAIKEAAQSSLLLKVATVGSPSLAMSGPAETSNLAKKRLAGEQYQPRYQLSAVELGAQRTLRAERLLQVLAHEHGKSTIDMVALSQPEACCEVHVHVAVTATLILLVRILLTVQDPASSRTRRAQRRSEQMHPTLKVRYDFEGGRDQGIDGDHQHFGSQRRPREQILHGMAVVRCRV